MKTSELLRAARAYVRDGWYVCIALDECIITEQDKKKANALRKRIRGAIYPHNIAHWWLLEQIGVCEHDKWDFYLENKDDICRWRVRWVNEMIVEYEAKGD